MITITLTFAILVVITGLIAIVLGIRDKAFNNSTTWFYTSFWFAALALLWGPVVIR